MSYAAITITNVSKLYRKYAYRRQFSTLKSALLKGSLAGELKPEEVFHAVNGVSLNVAKGSTLGVIGRNGSGKSTLLKLIAGIRSRPPVRLKLEGEYRLLLNLGLGFIPRFQVGRTFLLTV